MIVKVGTWNAIPITKDVSATIHTAKLKNKERLRISEIVHVWLFGKYTYKILNSEIKCIQNNLMCYRIYYIYLSI